ncbi:MAG: hypothetical protein M0R46_02640 [Candidatus Muirbacterium halophilum]|nr:hypothetical protein [Candidatus Muirbacterium halophilum]MCK9474788.1 hypothetical protein [Candidatus Muirbacterium halophilum]
MNNDIFNSKISELTNIISGRISVHINDFFGNITDIELPNVNSYITGELINRKFQCNAYVFYTEFFLDKKDISVLLYINKHIADNLNHNSKCFFDEISDDIKFILCEILKIFAENDNFNLKKYTFNCDFLESFFNNEVQKRTKDKDNFDYIFNNIFLREEKTDFGGILVFF